MGPGPLHLDLDLGPGGPGPDFGQSSAGSMVHDSIREIPTCPYSTYNLSKPFDGITTAHSKGYTREKSHTSCPFLPLLIPPPHY